MDSREKDLACLHSYIDGVDKEVTMILQSLQWDRKHLLECSPMETCKYDSSHKMPPDKKEAHENQCLLRCSGYTEEDQLLPDPVDPGLPTLVKLGKEDIAKILNKAATADPSTNTVFGQMLLWATCLYPFIVSFTILLQMLLI